MSSRSEILYRFMINNKNYNDYYDNLREDINLDAGEEVFNNNHQIGRAFLYLTKTLGLEYNTELIKGHRKVNWKNVDRG